jgi:calcium/calmodulin-dependent protein kinase I
LLTTEQDALKHPWLEGLSASDHNLLPEIRAYVARARLRRGIELVKLANRIEALKMHDDEEDADDADTVPGDAAEAVGEALAAKRVDKGLGSAENPAVAGPSSGGGRPKKSLSNLARGAIFREVVLAKVREEKEKEALRKATEEAEKAHGSSP